MTFIKDDDLRILFESIDFADEDLFLIFTPGILGISFEYKRDKRHMWMNFIDGDSRYDGFAWDECYCAKVFPNSVSLSEDMVEEIIPLSHPLVKELLLTLQMMSL